MTYAPRTDLSEFTADEREEHFRVYQREYARTERRKAVRRKYNQSEHGKAKNNAQCIRWRKENPEKYRASLKRHNLKRHYSLTTEQYNGIFAEQDFKCAACRTDTPTKIGWVVDHCHAAKHVRGILCSKCNTALGMVKDSPATLRALADYLERGQL